MDSLSGAFSSSSFVLAGLISVRRTTRRGGFNLMLSPARPAPREALFPGQLNERCVGGVAQENQIHQATKESVTVTNVKAADDHGQNREQCPLGASGDGQRYHQRGDDIKSRQAIGYPQGGSPEQSQSCQQAQSADKGARHEMSERSGHMVFSNHKSFPVAILHML